MRISLYQKGLFYFLLIAASVLMFFPIVYAVLASLMTPEEIMTGKLFPASFMFDNFTLALKSVPLMKFMLNSLIISLTVMLGQIIVCCLAAYAIVFIPFKGRNFIFFLLISTMMIPWEATMIPNYLTIVGLNWVNTYQGLSLPFFALAFGVFLLRQHFLTLPHELHESAQLEGCGRLRYLVSFVIPLSMPMLSALGVYGFLTTWNMYLWPLLTTTNNNVRTIQIGLKMMQAQETNTNWPVVMAGVVIVLVPTLLFLFLSLKQLRRGLMSGALKG
ncbi:carbohydrate ABC transporter permease [Paenibacillus sp. MER TA 81-3]|uniref:carbohydrate ABC transporter permease n=1 Tax=Paenibacillus sp. MER TA 81-3 TaxID=2939573 RepID=UPI002040A062|nr:carbohydrate ABC transporter permease [Paenibacillus sp. MER TA 81-3]MCM3339647.1 carbohydrate ABC transporter permease [Paenibacillus sp. MER TA 81-3]